MNDTTADTPEAAPLIDDERLDALFTFLDSERVDEEALDLFAAHGLLVALAISTVAHEASERHALILESEPEWESDDQQREVLTALDDMLESAVAIFESAGVPDLPFDLEFEAEEIESDENDDTHPIRLWCAGFMEGVFLDESAWFGDRESSAAELLLPFMTLSGLFDDEDPELAALGRDPRGATRLARQLPELTLDLFLLYRAPLEKAAPPPGGGKGGSKNPRKGGARRR